jgi:hypothetical protein
MTKLRRSLIALPPLVLAIVLMGCSREPGPRPATGDVVSVLIFRPKSWTAGEPVVLNAKLRVQGSREVKGELLAHESVPEDSPPRVTLTFLKDAEVVKVFDNVAMKPDC